MAKVGSKLFQILNTDFKIAEDFLKIVKVVKFSQI